MANKVYELGVGICAGASVGWLRVDYICIDGSAVVETKDRLVEQKRRA